MARLLALTVSAGTTILSNGTYSNTVADGQPAIVVDGAGSLTLHGGTLNGSSGADATLIQINTTGTVDLGTTTTIGNNTFNLNGTNALGSAYINAIAAASVTAVGNKFDTDTTGGTSYIDFTTVLNYADLTPALIMEADTVADGILDLIDDGTRPYSQLFGDTVIVTQASETLNAGAISRGVALAPANGYVLVGPGTFEDNVTVATTGVSLLGAQAGQDANARYALFMSGADGPKADPSMETVVTTPTVNPQGSAPYNDVFRVLASGVTIDGFVIDGNNPSLTQTNAIQSPNGINVDGEDGITNFNAAGAQVPVGSIRVVNNIIQNFGFEGIQFDNGSNATPTTGSLFQGNVLSNNLADGIGLFNNFYGDVKDNQVIVPAGDFYAGIDLQDFYSYPGAMEVSGNKVTVGQDSAGIFINQIYNGAITLTLDNNKVQAAAGVTGTDDFTWGVILWSVGGSAQVMEQHDTIGTTGGEFARGIEVWNVGTGLVSISDTHIGSGAVAPLIGVNFDNIDAYGGAGDSTLSLTNDTITGATYGVRVRDDALPTPPPFGANIVAGSVEADISGGTISGGTAGIYVQAPAGSSPYTAAADVSGAVDVSSSATGVDIVGAQATITVLAGSTLTGTVAVDGGTLAGSGDITGNVTVNTGTINPGDTAAAPVL